MQKASHFFNSICLNTNQERVQKKITELKSLDKVLYKMECNGKTKWNKNCAKLRWARVGRTVYTHTLSYSVIWIRIVSSLCGINSNILVTDICIKLVSVHWIQRGVSSHVQRNAQEDANTLKSVYTGRTSISGVESSGYAISTRC